MGKTRRLALLFALSAAVSIDARPVFAQSSAPEGANEPGAQESSGSDGVQTRPEETPEERAAKQAKRRERLETGAKRLRERAAELRKKAANGETPPEPPPNSKRPRRTFEEQATRLEEQASKMEERSKNLDAEPPRSERSTLSGRQRRHQIRRSQLNKRWGATLRNPEAISELKLHAERSAKLRRIRVLALQKSKDDPAAARANALIAKEEARHERHMKELQAQTPAAPASTQNAGEEAK
jgi:hypothetical protein